MKRLYAWVAGAAGGLVAYRAMKGKRPRQQPVADTRAAALKARLEAARTAEDDRDASAGEAPIVMPMDGADPLDPEPLDPGARRAKVHEQGRAALDEMHGQSS